MFIFEMRNLKLTFIDLPKNPNLMVVPFNTDLKRYSSVFIQVRVILNFSLKMYKY